MCLAIILESELSISEGCSFQDVLKHLNLTKADEKFTVSRPVRDHRNLTWVLLEMKIYAILDVVSCYKILLLLLLFVSVLSSTIYLFLLCIFSAIFVLTMLYFSLYLYLSLVYLFVTITPYNDFYFYFLFNQYTLNFCM